MNGENGKLDELKMESKLSKLKARSRLNKISQQSDININTQNKMSEMNGVVNDVNNLIPNSQEDYFQKNIFQGNFTQSDLLKNNGVSLVDQTSGFDGSHIVNSQHNNQNTNSYPDGISQSYNVANSPLDQTQYGDADNVNLESNSLPTQNYYNYNYEYQKDPYAHISQESGADFYDKGFNSDQTLLVDNQYDPAVQPFSANKDIKNKNPFLVTNIDIGKVLTVATAILLITSIILFFFAILPKFGSKVVKVDEKNIVSAFSNCKKSDGEIIYLGVSELCKKDGVLYSANYSKEEYNNILSVVERNAAEQGQIIYFSSNSKDLQRFVVGSYYKTKAVPNGVVAYISSNPELTAIQVINNLFLKKQVDGQKDNDVFVSYVEKFLDRDPQYTGAEPLGEESAVLKAFDVNEQRTRSRTIGEIGNLKSGKLDKIRAVYGVDGADQEKRIVTVRVFGQVRDNVILLQNNIPKDVQANLENNVLGNCRAQFKFKTDIQNCYINALKSDQTLANEAGQIAVKMLQQYDLQ